MVKFDLFYSIVFLFESHMESYHLQAGRKVRSPIAIGAFLFVSLWVMPVCLRQARFLKNLWFLTEIAANKSVQK